MADADADYRAWVEVLPDFQRFNQRVQEAVNAPMAQAGTTGSTAMGGALVAGIGKFAAPIAIAVAGLGIGTAIYDTVKTGVDSAVAYIKDSVGKGSDYYESLNAIRVSYGEFADEIGEISERAADDFGLSKVDFNQIATRFSGFAATIRRDDPAGFIEELTARGADFASVFNIDVNEALTLFQSGLAGETEPLRRYGIDLSAASVAAYAYANGIAEAGTELNATQRQQAAYGLLLEQTDKVQGDFKNTSDELANSQRIMQANLADIQAELGTAFLPTLTEVMAFARDDLLPVWRELNETVGPALAAALDMVWGPLEDLGTELTDLFEGVLPGGISVFGFLAGQIIIVAAGLATLISWVTYTAGIFGDLFALLRGDISFDVFVNRTKARAKEFAEDTQRRTKEVEQAFVNIVGRVEGLGPSMYAAGERVTKQFASGLQSSAAVRALEQGADNVLMRIQNRLPRSPAKEGPFSGAGWWGLPDSSASLLEQWASGFDPRIVEDAVDRALNVDFAMPSPPAPRPLEVPLSARVSNLEGSLSGGLGAEALFPQTVTLVDRDGSLLGHMDVRIGDALGDIAVELVGGRA